MMGGLKKSGFKKWILDYNGRVILGSSDFWAPCVGGDLNE